MPRQARIDYPGAFHHVIGRGIEGKYIFKEERDKEALISRIKETLRKSSMQMYAWCIMSNHFHLLIQTGKTTLSEFMRKILTGYAVNYNKLYKRKGYLFQNRYKSIVCDKDEYFLPLVRYIHLNPVKARLVAIEQLKSYRWSGHKEIVKDIEGMIDKDEILGYFGRRKKEAIEEYERYVKSGVDEEEDFSGGGLIRSLGGVAEAMKTRKDERQVYDDRILGSGDFVNEVMKEAEMQDNNKRYFKNMKDLLVKLSKYYNVKSEDIVKKKGFDVKEARNVTVYLAKKYLDVNATATGKLLGITQSTASRAMTKGMDIVERKGVVEELSKL